MTSEASDVGPGKKSSDRQNADIHGVLINVGGTGVLITGSAGIGKSACALELVVRGHRLVADDVVSVTRDGERIIGTAPDRFAGLLAVRPLGIINVRELFGHQSFDICCEIGLTVELRDVKEMELPDPFLGHTGEYGVLGITVRKVTLPAGDAFLASLIETAARIVKP